MLLTSTSFAQIEIKAVMGINFTSVPSAQDYINQNFAPSNNQLGSFNSSIIFAAEAGYFLSPSFLISAEGAYQLFSYTNVAPSGKYELIFNTIPFTAIGYYVIAGNGYNIKFGAGAGPRFLSVEESLPATGSTITYSATGVGFLIRMEGNTLLGGDFYANLGAELRYDINGEPESNGAKLRNNIQNEFVNFDSFALGLRIGFAYYFGKSD